MTSDWIILQFLKQVIDVVVVDLDIRDKHTVVVVLIDVDTAQFTHTRSTIIAVYIQ